MKRRNFLAALIALPFASPKREKLIAFSWAADVDWPDTYVELTYENHTEIIRGNTEAMRRLFNALRANVPTGFKST